jgi:hypothetical protein
MAAQESDSAAGGTGGGGGGGDPALAPHLGGEQSSELLASDSDANEDALLADEAAWPADEGSACGGGSGGSGGSSGGAGGAQLGLASAQAAAARARETNIRNYSSTSAGFRGIFSTPTNIPFTNLFSEPVVVRPTNAQITNATRTFNYTTDLSNNIRCPITLEEFQEHDVVCEIKHCRHLFKENSIMDWFQRNVRCPVCRYDIRDYREAERGVERQEINETPDQEQPQSEPMDIEEEEERNSPIFPDAGPFYVDLSRNFARTSSPLRRQGSPNLNTVLMNSVNNQINTIANNISNILHNYIEQDNTQPNDSSSNVFTFEIPIIYFDVSNART